tara:strand:- start:2069 stop:2443 length:375 start_codon:yes stop_codon:yes gene_type:complete
MSKNSRIKQKANKKIIDAKKNKKTEEKSRQQQLLDAVKFSSQVKSFMQRGNNVQVICFGINEEIMREGGLYVGFFGNSETEEMKNLQMRAASFLIDPPSPDEMGKLHTTVDDAFREKNEQAANN